MIPENDGMLNSSCLPVEQTIRYFIDGRDGDGSTAYSIKCFETLLEAQQWDKTLRTEVCQPLKNALENNKPRNLSETFEL